MGLSISLIVKPEKCTGCRLCELACQLKNPGPPRIRTVSLPYLPFYSAVLCLQCAEPKCAEPCPTAAITKDQESGLVAIDENKCVGCGLCLTTCPYAGIYLDARTGKAIKCHHCQGLPECVQCCPTGALEYRDLTGIYAATGDREEILSPGLSACQGCAMELAARVTLKVLGKNTILAAPPGCLAGIGSVGMGANAGAVIPIFHPLLTNTAAMLGGIKRHYQRVGRKVNVVAFAGDGGVADAGFQSLSGAAERGDNIIIICYDNEGYMNTGAQRSGTTPLGAWTSTTPVGVAKKGKGQPAKNMALIMAAHNIPFAATANIAYMEDFLAKLKYAMTVENGLSYIHLFSPCPVGWKFPPSLTLEISRRAVETNLFPLWEAKEGKFRMTLSMPNPRPLDDYVKMMGKFAHLTAKDIQELKRTSEETSALIKKLVRAS